MGNSLGAAIESLRTNASQLNLITDKANAIVRRVEVFLSEECRLGFPNGVLIRKGSERSSDTWLEYRRIGNKFRLAIIVNDNEGNEVFAKAWAECSRDEKLSSLPFLPKLIEGIAGEVQAVIEKNKQAVIAVEQLLKAFGATLTQQPYGDDEQQFRDEDIPF